LYWQRPGRKKPLFPRQDIFHALRKRSLQIRRVSRQDVSRKKLANRPEQFVTHPPHIVSSLLALTCVHTHTHTRARARDTNFPGRTEKGSRGRFSLDTRFPVFLLSRRLFGGNVVTTLQMSLQLVTRYRPIEQSSEATD